MARGVELELGGHEPAGFASADLIVVSPGVPLEMPAIAAARARGVPVIGEMEQRRGGYRDGSSPLLGLKASRPPRRRTGRMLQAAGYHVTVGGNFGAPLSAQVEASTTQSLHVVGASSFQLEAIDTFHPWIAVLMNISPDHLDRHPGEEAYGQAKAQNLREPDRRRLVDRQCRRSGRGRSGVADPGTSASVLAAPAAGCQPGDRGRLDRAAGSGGQATGAAGGNPVARPAPGRRRDGGRRGRDARGCVIGGDDRRGRRVFGGSSTRWNWWAFVVVCDS